MAYEQVQRARNTAAILATQGGAAAEIVVATDNYGLVVRDGATLGGHIVGGHEINAQTGTSYTILASDQGKLITFNNAAAVAVTVLQAVAANNFGNGARFWVRNLGAGLVTLTPTTSTINGAASVALPMGGEALVISDGTNYTAIGVGRSVASPRTWATGSNAPNGFTDQTPVATEVYACEIFVPANTTITGIAIRSGSVASGNVKVGLADAAGNVLKTSASTAVAGAAGVYQRIPFTGGAYVAPGPATYFVLTFYDNATVRGSTHTEGDFGAGKLTAQTYATGFVSNAALAPTTFTTALGPVASLY